MITYMFQKHAYSYIYIYLYIYICICFFFICRYYIMCIVSLHPALLPMAPFLGVFQVSLSCLRTLEAPPAHQVPTSFSAGQGLEGNPPTKLAAEAGFVYRISMDICVLVLPPWLFCCLVTQFFSVQHTFHVPEPVTQGA